MRTLAIVMSLGLALSLGSFVKAPATQVPTRVQQGFTCCW